MQEVCVNDQSSLTPAEAKDAEGVCKELAEGAGAINRTPS